MTPRHYTSSAGMPNPKSQTHGLTLALRLLAAFPDRVPSATEVQLQFDCSRATAYRWRAAFKAAHPNRVLTIMTAPATVTSGPSHLDTLRAQMRAIEKAPPTSVTAVAANEAADDPDAGRIVEVETA